MDDIRVEWLNLPRELWLVILSKNINNTFDVIRFRGVCPLWRSVIPPSFASPSHTLGIPRGKVSFLQASKVYRLEPLVSTYYFNKGWIIKIEETKSEKLRILDALNNTHISYTRRKTLDFTNLRVTELFQACTLNFSKDGGDLIALKNVYKVVMFLVEDHDQPFFALLVGRVFWVSNIGDKNLKRVDDENKKFDDMILHKGKVYVVDGRGAIYWFNGSSSKLVQFSPNLNKVGDKKYLVESQESLFVVDMYRDIGDIKVSRFDEKSNRWFHAKSLGDYLFLLGIDSNFSLSTKNYHGFRRNCIYFHTNKGTDCFSLKTSEFEHIDDIFLPCLSLFNFDSNPNNILCGANELKETTEETR